MQRLFVIENCSEKIKSIYFTKTEIHEYHMRYTLAKMFHGYGLNLNNESDKMKVSNGMNTVMTI